MTDANMTLMTFLRKHRLEAGSEFLQEAVQMMMQMPIELEAGEKIGANRYERSPERITHLVARSLPLRQRRALR